MTKKDLAMIMGSIAELEQMIENTRDKYQRFIDLINEEDSRTEAWKKEQISINRDKYSKEVNSLKREIKECVKAIRDHVNRPYTYNPEIAQDIDFLITMRNAGATDYSRINSIVEKYRGDETSLLYLRQKLKEAKLPTSVVDDSMFGCYKLNLNQQYEYISPNAYFDDLEKLLTTDNNPHFIVSGLRKTEQILGIESEGLKDYSTKVTERHNAQMAKVF